MCTVCVCPVWPSFPYPPSAAGLRVCAWNIAPFVRGPRPDFIHENWRTCWDRGKRCGFRRAHPMYFHLHSFFGEKKFPAHRHIYPTYTAPKPRAVPWPLCNNISYYLLSISMSPRGAAGGLIPSREGPGASPGVFRFSGGSTAPARVSSSIPTGMCSGVQTGWIIVPLYKGARSRDLRLNRSHLL